MKSAEKLNETLTSFGFSRLKKVQKDREVWYKKKVQRSKYQLASSFSDVIPGLDGLTIPSDCHAHMWEVKEKLNKCHTRKKITHKWRKWGTPQNFCLAFYVFEKQLFIKKTVEVGQQNLFIYVDFVCLSENVLYLHKTKRHS